MRQTGWRLGLRRRRRGWLAPHFDVGHDVEVTDHGDGIFSLTCTCGEQTYTPWGEEEAKRKARQHFWVNAIKIPPSLMPR